MNTKEKKSSEPVSIVEAIETLSSIADMELDRDFGIAREHQILIQGRPVKYRTVHWLQQHDADTSIDVVKETFKVVLNYLKKFYQTEYAYVSDPKKIEGIKTIMLLIGEAAKKLDRYTSLFKHHQLRSVTELKEFKQLQEFYFTKVSKQTDEGLLGKRVLALTQVSPAKTNLKLQGKKSNLTKHLFVDLESVKKDTEYELFFIRKEDGSRFFSPRLIRNIKLVCDFGSYFNVKDGDDPLANSRLWEDICIQASAKNLIRSLGNTVDRFYQEAAPFKDRELVNCLKKTLMALFLSASNQHLYDKNPAKSCKEYFHDFQSYFRTALHSREYHKLLAYPPRQTSKIAHCLLDTMHAISMGLFEFMQGYQEFAPILGELFRAANVNASPEVKKDPGKEQSLWSLLGRDYAAMSKLMKRHPHGPIRKVLNYIDEGFYHYYDPISQGNLPNILFHVYFPENKMTCVRLPSPTSQEFIHKGVVTNEFKSFLQACSTHTLIRRHLLFNLQDRTSWKEHMRCLILEELQEHPDFKDYLTVITLPKDTDFYHQLSPYHQDNNVGMFIKHLKEHLTDESTGIWMPEHLHDAIFSGFIDSVIDAVHRIFFSGKNVLLREHRMDFIEIVYLFLQLKIIEIIKPDSFSMTCKDGIDTGASASAELYAFLRLMQPDVITTADYHVLSMILYTPALLNRERIMLVERFNRFLNVVRVIEGVRDQLGSQNFAQIIHEAFGWLYKTQVFNAKLIPLR